MLLQLNSLGNTAKGMKIEGEERKGTKKSNEGCI